MTTNFQLPSRGPALHATTLSRGPILQPCHRFDLTRPAHHKFFITRLVWILLAGVTPVARILPPVPGLMFTVAVAASIAVALIMGRVTQPRSRGVWVVAAVLILASTVITVPRSGDLKSHLLTGMLLTLLVGAGPFVACWMTLHLRELLRHCAIAFVAVQSISSLTALAQSRGISVFGMGAIYGRSSGLSGHPNILGLFSSIALICAVDSLSGERGGRRRVLIAAAGLINAGGLVTSGSLSSMVALFFGLVIVLVTRRVSIRVPVFGTAVLSVVIVVSEGLTGNQSFNYRTPTERFLQVTGQTTQIGTLQIRVRTIEYAWNYIKQHPVFGAGLDDRSGATFDGITLAHNILIRSWFQGGALMAIAMLLVLMAAALGVATSMKRGEAAAGAGVLVTVIAFALTAAFFQQPFYWLPLLACWAALTHPRPQTSPVVLSPAPGLSTSKRLAANRRRALNG